MKWKESRWKRLEGCRNISGFWKELKKFKPRRQNKGSSIKKEQWLEYFRGMLGENEKGMRGGREEEEKQEDQEDKERDGERINANWMPEWELDFSEEEVKEATKRIKRNKTGEDKLIVEFFKELPNETYKE